MSDKEVIGSKPDGTSIYGTRIEIEKEDAKWLVFELKDKTVIRIKVVLTRVFRAENEYVEPTGDPLYLVAPQFVLDVTSPPELRRAAK